MGKLKTTLEIVLVMVIAAFVGAMALGFFVDLFWAADSKPSDAFRGAFLGAFFAFIFVRVGETLNRLYQAGRESRRALGRIQFNLNEALSIANDNQFVLEQWRAFFVVFEKRLPTGNGIPVFANKLVELPGSKDVLIDLTSIGLINELFLLESSIRKLNDSMMTWESAYQDAKKGFMDGKLNLITYAENTKRADEQVGNLDAFLKELIEEILTALAATRLLLANKPFLSKLYGWVNPDRFVRPDHPERQAELKKLRSEAAEIGRESRARIEAIVAKIPGKK